MKQTINKRVHYSYLDDKKGTLTGYIDLDLKEGEEVTEKQLKKYVQKKWYQLKYITGFLDTIQIESIQ